MSRGKLTWLRSSGRGCIGAKIRRWSTEHDVAALASRRRSPETLPRGGSWRCGDSVRVGTVLGAVGCNRRRVGRCRWDNDGRGHTSGSQVACGAVARRRGLTVRRWGRRKGRRWERKCGWRCRLGTMQIPNARRGTRFRQRPHSGKSLGICFVLSFLVSCVRVLDTKDLYCGCKELDEKNGCTHGHECPGSDPRLDTKIMLVDTDTSAQDLILAIGVLKARVVGVVVYVMVVAVLPDSG
ncbi:putative classical arabinogalactan protein 9 [Iris pallida]|uniref:Classical arabinogalactan protein 9 n=1 Tax=Iris pallida TaxID=29817 RepID=A0AAX6GGZ9_IRIPA|nr:putative classical arabinogalactan protein 9 [Iris pallida]